MTPRETCWISGASLATTSSASAVDMISGGNRRITLSAVTLIRRPLSARRPGVSMSPQGLVQLHADHQAPWPRNVLDAPTDLRARARGRRAGARPPWPRSGQQAVLFHDAQGFDPCAHGQRVATEGCAVIARLEAPVRGTGACHDDAPMGTPEPSPLASGITSGLMPAHWCANHLPVRPDAALHFVDHQQPLALVADAGAASADSRCAIGLMPPSPWMVSRNTATTLGLPSVAFFERFDVVHRHANEAFHQRAEALLHLFVAGGAQSVAMLRPWKAFS
jgi:hypothetical protein